MIALTPLPSRFDVRAEFPVLRTGLVPLNHAGVSPISARAAAALALYAREASEQIPSAFPAWYARIARAREAAARLLGANSTEIAFTKSTTHGLLLAAHSIPWRPGDVIVVEQKTFPANWYTWKALEARHGVKLCEWPEHDFAYRLEDLDALLAAHPVRLVCISAVDYATGFAHDLAAVGERVRRAGALFGIDGIQRVGALAMDLHALGADFLSADGHKWLLGPEGCGVLFVRRKRLDQWSTAFCGWLGNAGSNDYEARDLKPAPAAARFEEGAPNIPGIHALGASIELLNEVGLSLVESRLAALGETLREGMARRGWRCVSPEAAPNRSAIHSFTKEGVDTRALEKNLVARGVDARARRGFLRLAPHFYQDLGAVEAALDALDDVSS